MNDEARGLWVGIGVPKTIVPVDHPLGDMFPKKEPHITIAHFGRHEDTKFVDRVRGVLREANMNLCVEVEMTGWGLFLRGSYSIKVALINSADLFTLRSNLLQTLDGRGIDYDRKFGFLPHITLSSLAKPWETTMTSFKFTTQPPVLVWGDARYDL